MKAFWDAYVAGVATTLLVQFLILLAVVARFGHLTIYRDKRDEGL